MGRKKAKNPLEKNKNIIHVYDKSDGYRSISSLDDDELLRATLNTYLVPYAQAKVLHPQELPLGVISICQ
jgi:hypothetical protein